MNPIYDALQKYKAEEIYPFHMPGHKQGRGLNITDVMQIDITEIDGVDNLYHAEGVILEAQKLTAKLFGAEETFFLVNGSSSGVIASILSVCQTDDLLLVARNCHKSVYSGMIFAGAIPIYAEPEIIEPYGLAGALSPQKIEKILSNKNIKAVIITSPTYEGFTSDTKTIADIVHRHNAVLIVDEAHGAHFKFHNIFPKTALEQGADIVIQSLHKTLPSLTQTALLHIQGTKVDREILKQMLSMIQSSSPSYILMSSIDLCRTQISKQKFDIFADMLNKFRDSLKNTKVLRLLELPQSDISKIIIYCCTNDITGSDLDTLLRKEYKIQMEMCGLHHIVGIATIADSEEAFAKLSNAIYNIDKNLEYLEPKIKSKEYIKPKVYISPRQAMYAVKTSVPIQQSIGKISGEFIIPYPPGIPIVAPGEFITEEIISIIYQYKKNGIPILGTKDYNQYTIQILK